jgi:aryl-alcohol dehydrogenase-like predicted oxidoreductase
MIPLCREEGLGYMAWSPLARGRLTGPEAHATRLAWDPLAIAWFDAHLDEPVLTAFTTMVQETGFTHAELALAWLRNRDIVPVIGPSSLRELDRSIAALERVEDFDFAAVEAAYRPHKIIGFGLSAERLS